MRTRASRTIYDERRPEGKANAYACMECTRMLSNAGNVCKPPGPADCHRKCAERSERVARLHEEAAAETGG